MGAWRAVLQDDQHDGGFMYRGSMLSHGDALVLWPLYASETVLFNYWRSNLSLF
jgi:hypothetical protein